MQPTLTPGIVVKSHRHIVAVDVGGEVVLANRRQVRSVSKEPEEWTTSD